MLKNKNPREKTEVMKGKRANPNVADTCPFYNVNACSYGNKCRLKHVCWICGGKHTWLEKHA